MTISIDFYEGAYGATLRIKLHEVRDLETVVEMFSALAAGRKLTIDLLEDCSAQVTGISNFTLLRVRKPLEKRLRVEGSLDQEAEVVWEATSEEWENCLGLTNAFKIERSGHQYLTAEGVDDALVVLSFREG
ncbi:MAG: hypothetical protein AAF481_00780 [Acidobacteriota bacterium]